MKKKIISLLLAAVMVFSLLPVTAMAETYTYNERCAIQTKHTKTIYLPVGGKYVCSLTSQNPTLDISTSDSTVASVSTTQLTDVKNIYSTDYSDVTITGVSKGTATVTVEDKQNSSYKTLKYGTLTVTVIVCDSVTTSTSNPTLNVSLKQGETVSVLVLNGTSYSSEYYNIALASGSDEFVTLTGGGDNVVVAKSPGTGISITGNKIGAAAVNVSCAQYKATISINVEPEWTTYSASGNTITATSSDGDYTDTLTILPPANLAYDENAKPATIQDSKTKVGDLTASAITYKKLDGQDYVSFSGTPTDKGTYKAYVSVTTGETTYTAETAPFTISDILGDAEVTTAPTLVTGPLTYNGSLQALIATAGTATHGTVKYFIEESGATAPTADVGNWVADYSADTLKRADADDYDIYYYADGDSCYNDTEVTKLGTLTIAKHQVALVWPTDDFTYNGTNQATSLLPYFVDDLDNGKPVTVADSDLRVKKETTKPTLQGVALPTFKDAGNYTAGVVRGFEHSDPKYRNNYTPTEKTQSKSYTMMPKALTATVSATKAYDGTTAATADQVTATVTTGIGGETLTISGVTGAFNSANAAECMTVTPDGTGMTVTAGEQKTNPANYTVSLPKSGTGSITAFNLNNATVALAKTEYAYTGDEIKPTPTVTFDAEGKNAIPAADYEVSYTNNTDTAASTLQTGAPTVTVTAKTGNVTNSKNVNFTITKAATPPSDTPTTYTANAVSATSASLSNMGITLDGAKIKSITPSTAATTYVITGVPSIIEEGQKISWTTVQNPSSENSDVYTLTIESTNYNDFEVTVTFAGKTTVTFDPAAEPVNGGDPITFSDSGTTYDVTAPTVSVGGIALNPKPTMTYTYYQNTGSDSTPVWTLLDPNEKPTDAGTYRVTIAVDDTDEDYTGSQTYEFTIAKATQTAPAANTGFSIDYKAETLTASGDTYEVSSSDQVLTPLENNEVTPGGTYYVRFKGNDNHEPSPWTKISVPARPAAVSGVTAHQETYAERDDASLRGVSSTMEFCTRSNGAGEYSPWADGTGIPIGQTFNGSVTKREVKVRTKATGNAFAGAETIYTFEPSENMLTVTFSGTGKTQQVAWNGTLTKPEDPTPAQVGDVFGGWYEDEACTSPWDFTKGVWLEEDEESLTLYPKWIKSTVPSTVVSGTVTENENPVDGASVELYLGTVRVAVTTTNAQGNYSFDHVENGTYNIVVTNNKGENNEKTKTELVTVNETGSFDADVVLPSGDVSSVVNCEMGYEDTKSDFGKTVVGGLDAVAENNAELDKKVTVKLTVEPVLWTEDAEKIEAIATGKTVEFLDLKLTKSINNEESPITDTGDALLTIVFPFDFTNIIENSVTVYRCHSTQAETFARITDIANKADATFMVDKQNGTITVFAKLFSTYAIGYEEEQDDPYIPYIPVTPTYTITGADTENGKLTISPKNASAGQTVTLTVTPDKGFKLETLTVLDKNGKEIKVKNLGNGKYSFMMPSGNVTISATFVNAGTCPQDETCVYAKFTDLNTTAWYHDGIHYCVENALMQGVSATAFDPAGTTTRAMIVTMLWRMEGEPVVNYAMSFKDVKADQWYTEAIRWAQSTGVVEGYSADTFGPNDPITREQMAMILYRNAKNHAIDVTNTNTLASFTDANKVSAWALDAMKWANAVGLVQGRTSTTLVPELRITRAEAATMVQRYCEKVRED